jgi:uncharacterized protein (DUF1015 family)
VPSLISKLSEHNEETNDQHPDLSLKQQYYLVDQGHEVDDVDCVFSQVRSEIL